MSIFCILILFSCNSFSIIQGQKVTAPSLQSLNYSVTQSAVKETIACAGMKQFHDPILGYIDLNSDLYCNIKQGRNIPGLTCCHPQTPKEMDLKLFLFLPLGGQEQKIAREINFYDSKVKKHFRKSRDVVFIIHGFYESPRLASWINITRDGFLTRLHPVIVVDWSKGDQISFYQTAANTRTLGAAIGHAIILWKLINRTLLVGFSFGGQAIGEIGKYVIKKTGNKIKECHALDPGGPSYQNAPNALVLDKADCKLVQVIHSSAGFIPSNFTGNTGNQDIPIFRAGTVQKSGHCDFWINCGHVQEETCFQFNSTSIIDHITQSAVQIDDGTLYDMVQSYGACSHKRAALLYAAAVNYQCRIPVYTCSGCGSSPTCLAGDLSDVESMPPNSKCTSKMDDDFLITSQGEINNFCPNIKN